MSRESVVRTRQTGAFQVDVAVAKHALVSDVLPDAGGKDEGPDPHELLESALGACTAITVTMYAKRKQWPLEKVTVKVRHETVAGQTPPDKLTREVTFEGNLDAEQRARLLDVANKCPIHKLVTAGAKVETRAV